MTQKNNQFIHATPLQRKELVRRFNTTHSTVSLALHFKRHSPLALKIRDYAVNRLKCPPITY